MQMMLSIEFKTYWQFAFDIKHFINFFVYLLVTTFWNIGPTIALLCHHSPDKLTFVALFLTANMESNKFKQTEQLKISCTNVKMYSKYSTNLTEIIDVNNKRKHLSKDNSTKLFLGII